jgi:hypothetical protein
MTAGAATGVSVTALSRPALDTSMLRDSGAGHGVR